MFNDQYATAILRDYKAETVANKKRRKKSDTTLSGEISWLLLQE